MCVCVWVGGWVDVWVWVSVGVGVVDMCDLMGTPEPPAPCTPANPHPREVLWGGGVMSASVGLCRFSPSLPVSGQQYHPWGPTWWPLGPCSSGHGPPESPKISIV